MSANPHMNIGIGQAQAAQQFAPNQYNQIQSSPYSQQQAQAQAQQAFAHWAQQAVERREWMIAGKPMSFKEFADTLFPEDTPERTMFFLRYSK